MGHVIGHNQKKDTHTLDFDVTPVYWLLEERFVKYYYHDRKPRERRWIPITAVIVGLVVIVVGGFLVWRALRGHVPTKETAKPTKLPRMVNLPPKKKAPEPVAPLYSPDAPLLEQVREVMRKGIDPDGALELAKSLPDKPERADAAFILLEYAAEAGHAEAALLIGRYFDPTHSGESGTIIKDPAAAYEWYQVAMSGGQLQAKNHLSDLRQWVEKQAAQGSMAARELLGSWH